MSMLQRWSFSLTILFISCSSPLKPDIVFEDFEKADFANWKIQGETFHKPSHLDSVVENAKNVQGNLFAFSNFQGSGESLGQGKLVSDNFIIDRKYIRFLIAGGNHKTRECVNLIVKNKVVRTATGENDHTLREITWDVDDLQGENGIIEIVDALASNFEQNSLGQILVDNIVFSDFKNSQEIVFENFESGNYNNWKVEGDAFEIPRNRINVYYPITVNGFNGDYFAFSFGEAHDSKQGKLISKTFEINYDSIKFLIGGGGHENKTCINLVVKDSVVLSHVGQNDGEMRWHQWDVTPFKGQRASIEIVDHHSEGWGHIMVDDIIFFNNPESSGIWVFIGSALSLFFILYFLFKVFSSQKTINNNLEVSDEEIERFEKLKKSIETSKVYKDQNPNIKQIVQNTDISQEEINILFENAGNTTLPNFINYLRVEEFKRQLKDPSNKAYTMMFLAENSGFNSKTSFYRAFKTVTKMTPSEYKKSLSRNH
ncbi:AraC family transcriptional regulator [Arenibacter sp. 6A1]|uniref:helix-turn-helix domain-containing protein n=1 Tax=Arenibacter sp. 6A1 TaxID=2720391 RepID=UPI001446062B|nr:helix-turn-helix domain-containing protein [Arenibacter sp. 6A1]NKI28472.1 AraC family transcriptional regulator [Arenibacter sp. 6A1]